MSVRAVALFGFCLMVASVLHGGIYSAGHDFVVNRFTGRYEFVPADDLEEDTAVPTRARALTFHRAGVRVPRAGRGTWHMARDGR